MGALQGNGAASTSWTAISSVIIEAMKSLGFGYSTTTALTKEIIHLLCFAFDDDVDLVHSGTSNQTKAAEVLQAMQSVLKHWDGLLWTTGALLKCLKVIVDNMSGSDG